jgi:uncharacterized membrane protein YhhN
MNSYRALIFFLFWMALLIDCFLIFTQKTEYRVYTKPLLIPLLLVAIYIEARDTKHTTSQILINIAFFFCFLGDFTLLNDEDSGRFTLGLLSFLLAHLFFIFFFYRLKPFKTRHALFVVITAFIVLMYVTGLLYFIWDSVSIQNFEIPVVIYAVVLGVMVIMAINTIKNRGIKRIAKFYFIPGAVFFLISDTILALSKFYRNYDYSSVPVMVTYGLAIFFLTCGAIRFLEK